MKDDAAFWDSAIEVVTYGLEIKSQMLKAREAQRTVECPRCGDHLHFVLTGRRNHLRMRCEGKCGMEAME